MRVFLRALWPSAPAVGAFTIWIKQGKRSYHYPLREIVKITDADVAELVAETKDCDVYFGLGLRAEGLPGNKQGGKKDIIAIPGVWLDIDFYDPVAHKATNLPKDLEEASVLFEPLPDPSIIVGTGNGAQAGWLFQRPLMLEDNTRRTQVQKAVAAWQKKIIDHAASLGWHVDSTGTSQRVWRLPGFTNQKTGKPTELLYCDEFTRYDAEDFLGLPKPRSKKEKEQKKKDRTFDADANDADLIAAIRQRLELVGDNNKFHSAIQAALKGESMADPGERDETLQGVCSTIAWMPEGRNADPEQLAEVLRPSLTVWADEESDDKHKSLFEEMEKATDKIRRNQEDYWAKQAELRPQYAAIARALGVSFDDENQQDEKESNEFFLQHHIIQFRDTHYVFDYRLGRYSVPKTKSEVRTYARDAWADGPDELSVVYTNSKGETKKKQLPQLLDEYATNTDDVIGKMTKLESYYRPEKRTFYEAVARRRVTEGEFDPQIDEWLRLMVGDEKAHDGRPLIELVLDWIAAVPQLDRQNSALYLEGESGAGKTLLSNGLARLWREGPPTDFEAIAGNFNNDIAKCPLLRIDEGLDNSNNDITKKLRSYLGRQSFSLNEKQLATRVVDGAIRLIICANNSDVLIGGRTAYTQKDLKAIASRIFHVNARQEAADWLKKHNRNGQLTRKWVDEDGIARHCNYLCTTRKIVEGNRFLVEGDEGKIHHRMIMQGEVNGLVYEWLVRFASNPDPLRTRFASLPGKSVLAYIGDGQILVNADCVIACWDCYIKTETRPRSTRISQVLGNLSQGTRRLGPRNDRHYFHDIKPELVLEWCQQYQIGNEDRIHENVHGLLNDK